MCSSNCVASSQCALHTKHCLLIQIQEQMNACNNVSHDPDAAKHLAIHAEQCLACKAQNMSCFLSVFAPLQEWCLLCAKANV